MGLFGKLFGNDENADDLHQDGLRLYNNGSNDAALKRFERVLAIEPEHEGALMGRMLAMDQLKEDSYDIVEACDNLLRVDPRNVNGHLIKIRHCQNISLYDEALKHSDLLLGWESNNVGAQYYKTLNDLYMANFERFKENVTLFAQSWESHEQGAALAQDLKHKVAAVEDQQYVVVNVVHDQLGCYTEAWKIGDQIDQDKYDGAKNADGEINVAIVERQMHLLDQASMDEMKAQGIIQ